MNITVYCIILLIESWHQIVRICRTYSDRDKYLGKYSKSVKAYPFHCISRPPPPLRCSYVEKFLAGFVCRPLCPEGIGPMGLSKGKLYSFCFYNIIIIVLYISDMIYHTVTRISLDRFAL